MKKEKQGLGSIELLNVSGDELTIVNAARVSYGKESRWEEKEVTYKTKRTVVGKGMEQVEGALQEKDSKLIKYLIKHNHSSPLEHVNFTFRVKCPIFIARQWMRHRTWSYNEISYRYAEPSMDYYMPDTFRTGSVTNKQDSVESLHIDQNTVKDVYSLALNTGVTVYKKLLDMGVCREQARAVLPTGLMTEFYATVDLNNLIKFIKLRAGDGAQKEIKWYANEILNLVKPAFPNVFEEFKL